MTPTTRQRAEAQREASAPGASFEPFSRLPADIRQEIWRTASALPTCAPGIAYFEDKYTKPRREPCLVVQEPPNSNVMGTNTEAYDMALMTDPPTRPFNPETDILCITSSDAFEYFIGHECCPRDNHKWVTKIRHLAIGLSLVYTAQHQLGQRALVRLSSLQTISIVYPATSGTLEFRTEVQPPADRATPIRPMTEEEMSSLTIEADYMYNTWAGDFPVRWSSKVQEHVKSLERALDQDCRPSNSPSWGLSPLWDHDANRIALRYRATCFQPLPARERFNRQRD